MPRTWITATSASGEMVAGGVSIAELGGEVAARSQPWIKMVQGKLRALLAGSPLEPLFRR